MHLYLFFFYHNHLIAIWIEGEENVNREKAIDGKLLIPNFS